jgi:hypothetical protein
MDSAHVIKAAMVKYRPAGLTAGIRVKFHHLGQFVRSSKAYVSGGTIKCAKIRKYKIWRPPPLPPPPPLLVMWSKH